MIGREAYIAAVKRMRKEKMEQCDHDFQPYLCSFQAKTLFDVAKLKDILDEETLSHLARSYGADGDSLRDDDVAQILDADEAEELTNLLWYHDVMTWKKDYAAVDDEGRLILQCPKCGKLMTGEKVGEVKCHVFTDEKGILFVDKIIYAMLLKTRPHTDYSAGDLFVAVHVTEDPQKKSDPRAAFSWDCDYHWSEYALPLNRELSLNADFFNVLHQIRNAILQGNVKKDEKTGIVEIMLD